MNSTLGMSFLQYSSALLSYPNLTNSPRRKITRLFNLQRKVPTKVFAMHGDHAHEHDYDGKLVDEDMIGLRLRIHDMKMMEESCDLAPSNWMEWEKTYYDHDKYVSDICEVVGLLQSYLMNTRPSLALAILVLVVLSFPMSMGVITLLLIEIAKEVPIV